MNRSRQSGLTLLEMLVVISLTAMLSTLMFQGYGYLLGRYDYVKKRQSEAQRALLFESWFRESAESLIPYIEGELRFVGSDSEIRGASFAPLFGPHGVPTPVSWTLERSGESRSLWYRESEAEPVEIWRWPPGARAQFRFSPGPDRQWLTEWDEDQTTQLPVAVQLVIEDGSAPALTITAVNNIRLRQEVFTDDIMFGRE